MSAVFDIIILLILAGSIFAAIKKGFVKSIIGLAGIVLAIIIGVSLSPQIGATIDKNIVKPFIKENIVKTFSKALADEAGKQVKINSETSIKNLNIKGLYNDSNTPQVAKDILNSLNINSEKLQQQLAETVSGPEAQATMGSFVEGLIDKSGISLMISKAIAFFIIFIVVLILTKIVEVVAGSVTKLPVLKQSDKLLGAAMGVVNALITIFIFCLIVKAVSGFITPSNGVSFKDGVLDKTIVFKYFYNFNPFQWLKF